MRNLIVLGVISALVAIPVVASAEPTPSPTWDIDILDLPSDASAVRPVMDAEGNLHLTYHDYDNSEVVYARQVAGSWEYTTFDYVTRGYHGDLKLDSNGYPHVAYLDLDGVDLRYAYFDGSSWSTEAVDTVGAVGYDVSLALDSQDRPHVSYHDRSRGSVKYATNDGAGWVIQEPDNSSSITGWSTSLDLDSFDQPAIAYYDFTNEVLRLAQHDESGWHLSNVDDPNGLRGFSPSLVVDMNDRIHIAYHHVANKVLIHTTLESSGWQSTTVASDETDSGFPLRVGLRPSLAIDSQGRPQVSHYAEARAALWFAYFDGASWTSLVVDDPFSVNVGSISVLMLDENDDIYISYWDLSNRQTRFAHGSLTDTDLDLVDDIHDLCLGTVLAEPEPSMWLQNRYAANEGGIFVDAEGVSSGYTVVDTYGCSGEQIIDTAGLGRGHALHGVTQSAIQDWISTNSG